MLLSWFVLVLMTLFAIGPYGFKRTALSLSLSLLSQIAKLSLIIPLQKKLSKTVTPAICSPNIGDVSDNGRWLIPGCRAGLMNGWYQGPDLCGRFVD